MAQRERICPASRGLSVQIRLDPPRKSKNSYATNVRLVNLKTIQKLVHREMIFPKGVVPVGHAKEASGAEGSAKSTNIIFRKH